MMRFPPLPTLLLAGAVAATGGTATFLSRAPDTGGIMPAVSQSSTTEGATSSLVAWPGPRAETKREILLAPLFTEDRQLPPPFETAPPPRAETQQDPEPQPDARQATVAPLPPAPDTVADVKQEPPNTLPAAPAVPLDLPDLRLVGTFISEDRGIAQALLVEPDGGSEEVWVDEYGSYADWVLTIVSPEAVRLEAGEESLTLEMWLEK